MPKPGISRYLFLALSDLYWYTYVYTAKTSQMSLLDFGFYEIWKVMWYKNTNTLYIKLHGLSIEQSLNYLLL